MIVLSESTSPTEIKAEIDRDKAEIAGMRKYLGMSKYLGMK
jgi:hypothetical protein